ncbi:polysaccharide biosynthesis C-terminal domain-containing protein [Flavobacterium sp. NKUCC04_CG]|uniref:oligosaccharide flippase family protein n=1 Tax=Flavobacterium sp. NKUCC04_CG TaxID=2842121 RepID=UPI001C5AE1DB|nr:polysaccharide biosynthesis C-terminal domain-containing protein [Flavobacterium sp. NKUCC04_CG]MBW3520177.1 polysaccharide biosynthesis C-terminal domain-containing protein [Flavobacterium sp. NKUCC04_CG]
MSIYKKIFKQTAIYGLATVFPKLLGFFLVSFHTSFMANNVYGEYNIVFSIMMFFNVVLAFGMETAFFRFYNLREDKQEVVNNSLLYLSITSILFLVFGLWTQNYWSSYLQVDAKIIQYLIWILVLDALVIIPFSKLRANQRPTFYSAVKIGNVIVNVSLNIFFLYLLPQLAQAYPDSFFDSIYTEGQQVQYVFLANLIASGLTLLVFASDYIKIRFHFNMELGKQMIKYGFPVMIGGLAFAINESFDKILLGRLLPPEIALTEVGKYAACYKLGLFMVLFRQAYTLGIEPFFFNYAKNEDAPTKYATITKYFAIIGSLIMLTVIVFVDLLKPIMIPNPTYWEAMKVVPLIILANFCLGIYANLSVWYKLRDKTMIGAYISIFGAVLTIVLNYALIPIWSYVGSAIATLLAYGSMMLISYVLGNRYYPIPYDKKAIVGYTAMSVGLSALYFYVFRENYWIGMAFIAIFVGLLIKNEGKLIRTLMK